MSKTLKSLSFYTLIGFLPLSFGFFISPIYTHYLSPKDNGIINLFMVISSLLLNFFSWGIDGVFSVKHFEVINNPIKEKKMLKTIFSSLLFFGFLNSIILVILGRFFLHYFVNSTSNFSFYPNFIFVIVFTFSTVLLNFYLVYLRNKEKVNMYALISISSFLLTVVISLYFVVGLDYKSFGAITARTIATSLIALLIIFQLREYITFRLNKSLLKNTLILGFPICIYLIIGQLNYNIDRIIIERFCSIEDLGIYALAFLIASVSEIWVTSISNATSPNLYKLINENVIENKTKINSIFSFQIISLIGVTTLIIAFTPLFFNLAIHKNFHSSMEMIPALAFAFIGRILYVTYVPFIFTHNKTRYLPYINIITLVLSSILAYFCLKYLGMFGILIVFIFSKFIQVPIVYLFSKKCYTFEYHLRKEYILIFIISLCILAFYFFNKSFNLGDLFYYLPFIAFSIYFLIYYRKLIFDVIYLFKKKNNEL